MKREPERIDALLRLHDELGALLRGPGPGQIDIHTDYTDVPEPYPEYAMSGVAVWSSPRGRG